jgi:hypothetical protein
MAPQTLAEKAKAKLQAVLEDPNRNDASGTLCRPLLSGCMSSHAKYIINSL